MGFLLFELVPLPLPAVQVFFSPVVLVSFKDSQLVERRGGNTQQGVVAGIVVVVRDGQVERLQWGEQKILGAVYIFYTYNTVPVLVSRLSVVLYVRGCEIWGVKKIGLETQKPPINPT